MKNLKIGLVAINFLVFFLSGNSVNALELSGILTEQYYYASAPVTISNTSISLEQAIVVQSGTQISIRSGTHFENGNLFSAQIGEDPNDLIGVDNNQNDIRDDVETYINQTYATSQKTRESLYLLAKSYKFLLVAYSKENVINNALQIMREIECLSYINPDEGPNIADEITAQMLNTYERSLKYIQSQSHLGGQTFALTSIDDLKSSCSFDPDLLPN